MALSLVTAVRRTLVNFVHMLLDIKLETGALNHPQNDLENYKVNATPCMYYKHHPSTKLQYISLYSQPFFELQDIFRYVR